MSEARSLGTVVASREMAFAFADGRKVEASLKAGQPAEVGGGLDWCRPFGICIGSAKGLRGIHGIDSLQALDFAMKSLCHDIEYVERIKCGKFHYLDEEGAGI